MNSQQNTSKSNRVPNTPWLGWRPGHASNAFATAFRTRILSIDLDNVIRDQVGSIIQATRQRFGVSLTREMFNTWDPPLGAYLGISDEAFTTWAWTDRDIFTAAQPVAGALAGLSYLSRDHRIVITTSTAHPDLTGPWLKAWQAPHDAVIHTADKAGVAFDWHIDDSPQTLVKMREAGRRVIRFDLPWNAHLDNLPCAASWPEVGRLIR